MKNLKLRIIILLYFAVLNVFGKIPFSVRIENQSFETVHRLPGFKNEVRDGINSYTVKVLKADEITEDYFIFGKDVVIRSDLYTYSTTKFENANLKNYEDENSIRFKNNVYFRKGAVINFRTNVEKNLGDFINFESISLEGSELFIDIADNSEIPRFLKIPLFVVPENEITLNEFNVRLIKPLIIGEAEYVIKSESTGKGKILYFIEPLYKNEEIAQKYALMERKCIDVKHGIKKLPETALIREKITTFKEKGKRFIFTSNIIDLFIK
ncbi:hypothetical protein EII29_04850 [Leptotrichia sp. OH3620_COT-345]|uniref:hypothetical protein n=1 Tax=Leptotrichia sp. OH3620_COT-345 TaxID=2491048 RepID=UPI000F655858|nr:hypothetical protein [Leptotrichia sp. OH3620_COT-345]RRD39854.1 hypothetical protein EII29_04850 [Leptotrichia sp. OH3620_COT-345]